jgi:hypothetical protein
MKKIVVIFALFLVLAACNQAMEQSKPKGASIAKLTLEAVKNCEYYCEGKKFKLTDGIFQKGNPTSQDYEMIWISGITRPYLDSKTEEKLMVAFGDLNNDGKEDVAVILEEEIYLQRSPSYCYLAVVLNNNGNPLPLSVERLWGVSIEYIAIESGNIILSTKIFNPRGPDSRKIIAYKLSGNNELVESTLSQNVIANVTAKVEAQIAAAGKKIGYSLEIAYGLDVELLRAKDMLQKELESKVEKNDLFVIGEIEKTLDKIKKMQEDNEALKSELEKGLEKAELEAIRAKAEAEQKRREEARKRAEYGINEKLQRERNEELNARQALAIMGVLVPGFQEYVETKARSFGLLPHQMKLFWEIAANPGKYGINLDFLVATGVSLDNQIQLIMLKIKEMNTENIYQHN